MVTRLGTCTLVLVGVKFTWMRQKIKIDEFSFGHVEFEVPVAWQPSIFGILYTQVWLTECGQEEELQAGFPSDTEGSYIVEALKKKKNWNEGSGNLAIKAHFKLHTWQGINLNIPFKWRHKSRFLGSHGWGLRKNPQICIFQKKLPKWFPQATGCENYQTGCGFQIYCTFEQCGELFKIPPSYQLSQHVWGRKQVSRFFKIL